MLVDNPLCSPPKYDNGLEPGMTAMQAMKRQNPPLALHDVAGHRQNAARLVDVIKALPLAPGVEKKTFTTTASDGYELEMIWYSPAARANTPRPAILHCHGGGMIAFDVHSFHPILNNQVAASGVPLLSIDYRLAPEHPFPTPIEDCYTGLIWLQDHASELNVDLTRIGVMGESAGGGLAAGLALMARDRGFSPPLAKQILVYPMLDDRETVTDYELLPFVTFSYVDNLTAWSAYLGRDSAGTEKVSKYAAPAREMDLSNLPPAFIDVGDLDIFFQEDVDYARRLKDSKIGVDFHLYEGAPHAFEILVPDASVSKKAEENRLRAMKSF